LTDFSNYLDHSTNISDIDGSFTIVEAEGYCHVSGIDDAYGWNAEWDRRHVPGHQADAFLPQVRAAKRAKVSLLQRVLSVGKVTPMTGMGRRAGFTP
jgi:hypothetical protein